MAGWVTCFGSSRCPRSFDCPHILQHRIPHKTTPADSSQIVTSPKIDSTFILARTRPASGSSGQSDHWHNLDGIVAVVPPYWYQFTTPDNELHDHHPDRDPLCSDSARSPDLQRPCERHGNGPPPPQRDHPRRDGGHGAGRGSRRHHEGHKARSVVCSH